MQANKGVFDDFPFKDRASVDDIALGDRCIVLGRSVHRHFGSRISGKRKFGECCKSTACEEWFGMATKILAIAIRHLDGSLQFE